jgi:4-hydroxyphenylpyruvate dioxygenase
MTLPLRNYHSYEHYVSDLPRAEKFYTNVLGFKRIGKSRSESDERDGMQRLVLAGGRDLHVILTAPRQDWSVAARYLRLHPEGIGFLNFRVSDLRKTVDFLTPRRANFLYAPQEHQDSQGTLRQVAIATPLSDVNMRFIEDSQYKERLRHLL